MIPQGDFLPAIYTPETLHEINHPERRPQGSCPRCRFDEASRGAGSPGDDESSSVVSPRPALGVEGQRRADLGDGTYLNPIVSGDHPDPTVLKDGDDYYMTFSEHDVLSGDHHMAFEWTW